MIDGVRRACGSTAADAPGRPRDPGGQQLILAPGAYDLQVPFPGWDLPGVLTAGGAQALLKGHGVVAGSAGGGRRHRAVPAAGRRRAGRRRRDGGRCARGRAGRASVGAPHARSPSLGHPRRRPRPPATRHAWPGTGCRTGPARRSCWPRTATTPLEAVTVAPLDRSTAGRDLGRATGSRSTPWRSAGVSSPNSNCRSALAAPPRDAGRCGRRSSWWTTGSAPACPGCSSPARPAASAAPRLAMVEGEIAGGAAAAGRPGVPAPAAPSPEAAARLRRRAAPGLPGAGRVASTGWPRRHRGLPVRGGHRRARCARWSNATGVADARTVKLLVRPGMGWCQGRMCGYATSCLTASWSGAEPPVWQAGRAAPSPVPVPLGLRGRPSATISKVYNCTQSRDVASASRPTECNDARMTDRKPWHGVIVATALPFRDDLSVDFDAYAEHVALAGGERLRRRRAERLARRVPDADRRGAAPGGRDRRRGRAGRLHRDARRRRLRRAGVPPLGRAGRRGRAPARCMLLPPNAYRADERAVVEHYREVAKAGLPIVGVQQPDRHQGRPDPGAARHAARRGAHRRGQGVQRRRPPRLRDRRTGPGARPADRRRRRRARARAGRRRRAGSPATPTPSR